MAVLLSSFFLCTPPIQKPRQNPNIRYSGELTSTVSFSSRRDFVFGNVTLCTVSSLTVHTPIAHSLFDGQPPPSKSILSGIANTKSWFQFYGDGFAIRVPPEFEDITEPEDFNAGLSLYGDKAKPKTFAARFASHDGYEVLSVIMRSTNQLKITFLEAQDITDLGTLKEAAKIFVPGGAKLYTARTIKIKEDEGFNSYRPPVNNNCGRIVDKVSLSSVGNWTPIVIPYITMTYYFYEFGRDKQHVALVAAVNGGKAFIAGATAPETMWDNDGVRLRSAAVSLTLL